MRRAVVLLPNGFTLGNLLFGVWAIVAASRGEYSRAAWLVIFGGILDALDGRVARMTKTGSSFGVELDSLVDAVTFGVAPAFIMYFAVLNHEGYAWLFSFIYIACAVMRLARFNIEQGGRAKVSFHGLPSPAAGITLASYIWFSSSPLYARVAIPGVAWDEAMRWVMLLLAFLMISHVLYPAITNIGIRSIGQITQLAMVLIGVSILVLRREEYLFPALVLYVAWGLAKTVLLGVVDRFPSGDPLYEPEDNEEEQEARQVSVGEVPGNWRRRKRKRGRRAERRPPEKDRTLDARE
jgi:CDP-diacylglycerol--serine O-phosphatidyltransferase